MNKTLKAPGANLQHTLQRVTPDMAKRWLETNTNNRRLSQRFVDYLAVQMRDGTWAPNGETIKLDAKGHLVDGQHRLSAMVQAGRTLDLLVVEGVPKAAWDTIDSGKPRRLIDSLYREGEQHPGQLSAAVRAYAIVTGEQHLNARMPTPRGVRILKQHPGLRDAVQFAREEDARLVLTVGMAAGIYYRCTELEPTWSREFWGGVFSGVGLGKDDQAMKLRNRLLANRQAEAQLNRAQLYLLCKLSWEAFLSDDDSRIYLTKAKLVNLSIMPLEEDEGEEAEAA